MWRVSVHDLLHRRRRFVVAVLATGLAFGMSLLMQGMVAQLRWESRHIVDVFRADEWVVADGGAGPFTTMAFVPGSLAEEVAALPGVTAAGPFLQAREILDGRDSFVIGVVPGGLGSPSVRDGRAPAAPGEGATATVLGFHVGDRVELAGRPATVVGTVGDATYYFGQPVAYAVLEDVQQRWYGGADVANGIAVAGHLDAAPPGTRVLTDGEAVADIDRPQASGKQSITILDTLLFLMAAGIVATMVYLIALERTRDVAVLKAMGARNGTILGGVLLHGMLLALAALAVGLVVEQLLEPVLPFATRLGPAGIVRVGGAAVVVGLLASLVGYRRSTKVDPALAFGR
jgi:putative ABC transport system permease protein